MVVSLMTLTIFLKTEEKLVLTWSTALDSGPCRPTRSCELEIDGNGDANHLNAFLTDEYLTKRPIRCGRRIDVSTNF